MVNAIPHDAYRVTHQFKLTQTVCLECEEIIQDGLLAIDGVVCVNVDWHAGLLTVTYDIHKVRMDALEIILTEIGFPPDRGFFQRQKRAWMRYTDQNLFDSLKHQAACCSKPPKSV